MQYPKILKVKTQQEMRQVRIIQIVLVDAKRKTTHIPTSRILIMRAMDTNKKIAI